MRNGLALAPRGHHDSPPPSESYLSLCWVQRAEETQESRLATARLNRFNRVNRLNRFNRGPHYQGSEGPPQRGCSNGRNEGFMVIGFHSDQPSATRMFPGVWAGRRGRNFGLWSAGLEPRACSHSLGSVFPSSSLGLRFL